MGAAAAAQLARLKQSCGGMRCAYATGGSAGLAGYMLEQLPRQEGTGATIQLAVLHAEIGKLDLAFGHLYQAIDTHDPCLVHLAVSPQWDGLRGDARFQACLARMALTA